MEKKNRYTYTELVEALERDKSSAEWESLSYSTTLAMHSFLLLSMALAGEHHSPAEYANSMTGKAFTLDEILTSSVGLCTTQNTLKIMPASFPRNPVGNICGSVCGLCVKSRKLNLLHGGENNDRISGDW